MDPSINLHKTPFSNDAHERIASYFLGGKAENLEFFRSMIMLALDGHADARRAYYPEDPSFITAETQSSFAFQDGMSKLTNEFGRLSGLLNDYSIPFYSPRYAGHMCFETSMPAILGWILTVLYNPNNVAFEASPITTILELEVGMQMAGMLGYNTVAKEGEPLSWGHVACDGTVANLESIWSARNLKFYPLSLREAMKPGNPLSFIEDTFTIRTCSAQNEDVLVKDLSTWELLNLRSSDILDIPGRLQSQYGITPGFLEGALQTFLVQTTGKDALESEFNITQPCQYLVSSTKHYSWPKGAALAGIGSKNMVDVPVDSNARIDIAKLREALWKRLKRKQAVYAIVAIIGSTEEGAVDPLDEILELREEFEAKGMTFLVHADAAWGGYFASMIRDKPVDIPITKHTKSFVPSMTLRKSTVNQFRALGGADSITIDPHKAGYIPYPAGGLCYRDGRMRFLVTWTAPYINQGSQGESIGVYGVEGSKPGAPAAAVYLHHAVVGLHKEGHGMLLGEVSFTCTRLSAHWAAMSDAPMSDSEMPFIVVPFNPLPDESDEEAIQKEKMFIRERILGKSNEEVSRDSEAMVTLRELGSDLNINAFACNFRIGKMANEDVEEANYLNSRIFQRLSVTSVKKKPKDTPLFITSTTFAMKDYGECCSRFKTRIGLETESGQDLFVLRNVCMSPFVTDGDFVKKMAEIFEDVLKEETKTVIARNTISKQTHQFIVQGNGPFHLVYRPLFHHANGRHQLILSVGLGGAPQRSNPAAVYTLATKNEEILTDIIKEGCFLAVLSGEGMEPVDLEVTNIRVVKNRNLLSRYRDLQYPSRTPFYLYGTREQMHIDHMLLRAPNTQLCADNIKLSLESPNPEQPVQLTDEQLAQGLIVMMDTQYEMVFQPFGASNPPNFFKVGKYPVTVYTDSKPANASGPGLANVEASEVVGKGTLEIVENASRIWVDYTVLNTQDFTAPAYGTIVDGVSEMAGMHLEAGYQSKRMNDIVKGEWKDLVYNSLPAAGVRY